MIKEKFKQGKPVFSIEVFPPKKTSDIATIYAALDEFKNLNPAFISVTYGAGGSNSKSTAEIASYIKNQCHIEALSHLTCASLSSTQDLEDYIQTLTDKGVHNILALRGDQPKEMTSEQFNRRKYKYASDLVAAIKEKNNFFVAGGCYPEKHPEAATFSEDLSNLARKVEQGTELLISQLFYDNEKFYRFLEHARAIGIDVPITAGLMPITSPSQVKNILFLSSASIPSCLQRMIEKYKDSKDDLEKYGLEYTKKQMDALIAHGVDGIHLYSMNKVHVARTIFDS